MGFHGIIEFGNRLLTFLLIIIALAMFAFVVRMRRDRPELFRLSLVLGFGIPAQAILGGITVLTQLNPYVVGLHYLLSALLVGLAAVLVYRVRVGQKTRNWGVPAPVRSLTGALYGVLAISIVMGILTTGSGPHAGDGGARRNGLDSWLLQHFHAWPSYFVAGLGVTLLALAWGPRIGSDRFRNTITAFVALTGIQIAVGLYQARNGLPELFVGIHMVLAAILVAIATSLLLSQRDVLVTTGAADQPRAPQKATSDR
jgi:cytochrome c oxidase assembly protein subunit 15